MKGPLLILTLSPHDMFNMPLNFLIPTQLWFSPNTSHPLNQPQYEYWTASIYWAVKTLQFIPSFSFCMFFFLHIEKDELVQWYINIIRWLHVAKHVKPNITNLNIIPKFISRNITAWTFIFSYFISFWHLRLRTIFIALACCSVINVLLQVWHKQ